MTVVLKLKKEMDFKFRLTFNRVFMFSSIVILHHQILYFASQRALPVRSSVAKVQFSPVLPPFFENREPNRQIFFRTEQNWNRTV